MDAPADAEGNEEPRYADLHAFSPEDAVLRTEIRACLEQTLAQLDEMGRAVLILRDIEERSYQEVAEIFSIGMSAVKMRIHRARPRGQDVDFGDFSADRLCPAFALVSDNLDTADGP
jgi:RNA polymerase sigma-70 factor (ECF subfamily)